MKLKDYIEKYGEYEIKDENKLKGLLEKPKPKTVWNLKYKDAYWTIQYGNYKNPVLRLIWNDDKTDHSLRSRGNCFLTEKEARFEYKRREIIAEMKKLGARPFERYSENWEINYTYEDTPLQGLKVIDLNSGGLYFDSRDNVEKAIETIGKERLKKYYFGIEEDENENSVE